MESLQVKLLTNILNSVAYHQITHQMSYHGLFEFIVWVWHQLKLLSDLIIYVVNAA